MVTSITSFTNPEVEYDVTVENGMAVSCTCPDHENRHRTCKHMREMNARIASEIARAARFLAVAKLVQGMEETWRAYREMAWDSRF